MHGDNGPAPGTRGPWYKELSGYHWFVFIVCTLAWLFDCLDQQLFNLARKPAVQELMHLAPGNPNVDRYGGFATSVVLFGWATGGIIFGILADKIGRKRTLIITIFSNALFAGLTSLSHTFWDFAAFRFIAGMGIGGVFAVGVTMVAESLPNRARPRALGLLQTFSAVGNIVGGFISLVLFHLAETGAIHSAWRSMFLVGVIPAFLAVVVMAWLREPEAWLKASREQKLGGAASGSIGELFSDPRWRRNTIVGMLLAAAGVLGLWAIGVFSNDLSQSIFRKRFQEEYRSQGAADADLHFALAAASGQIPVDDLKKINPTDLLGKDAKDRDAQHIYATVLAVVESGKTVTADLIAEQLDAAAKPEASLDAATRTRLRAELANPPATLTAADEIARITNRTKLITGGVGHWASITLILFNVGAFFGIYAFARVAHWLGRRAAFAIFFVFAAVATIFAFLFMETPTDLYWMVPLMGFGQLSVFGGYAIYFPELFPTRLRATGTSFCYNIARYVAVPGPWVMTSMSATLFGHTAEPLRYAGATMTVCYAIGLVTLLFAPETKGKPLPE